MASFKRGDLILSSKPYVYVLNNTERGKRCDACFLENNNLKRCSQCTFLYFCNSKCQREAWEIHKTECKFISKASPNIPSPSLRLLTQIIIKTKKCGWEDPCVEFFGRKMSFKLLKSHASEIKQDPKASQQMVAMAETLREYIGCENVPPVAEFVEMFGKMRINTFSIGDNSLQTIGGGLFLNASALDHSCEPDAEVVFNGITIIIRAIRDIFDTDISKVYISYIDQMQLTEERQEYLREQYYFTCQCERCVSQDYDNLMTKVLVNADDAQEVLEYSKKELQKLKDMVKNNVEKSVIYETSMAALERQEGILDNSHILRTKIFEKLFDACIFRSQWGEAIAVGNILTETYRVCYSQFHPVFGVHLFKMGRMQGLLDLLHTSEKNLLQAEEVIKVCYGCDHSIYHSLLDDLKLCQDALRNAEKSPESGDKT